MKSKVVLVMAFVFTFLFISLASWFWYMYFLDLNNDGEINNNGHSQGRIAFISVKEANVVGLQNNELSDNVPSFDFRVENHKNGKGRYRLYLENIPYNIANDGCILGNTLNNSDMEFQLKLNGDIIDFGLLSSIENGVLNERDINVYGLDEYELKIWIKKDAKDWYEKHYHYKVFLEEVK